MSEEIFPIVLNQNNYVNENTFTYKFPRGSVHFKNASVSLSQINIYYSWGNIEEQYNNNKFDIIFPDATPATFTRYNVEVPYGNYTVEDLNQYLQHWSIQNNKYIVNASTGQNLYYMEFISNPQTYKIEFIAHDINGLPPGYLNPGGMTFPAVVSKPTLVILPNNNFGELIGFAPGAYFTSSSTKTPEMNPVSSVLVTCSLINNRFTSPNNVLYSFVSGSAQYGSMLAIQNQDMVFTNIPEGQYSECEIRFFSDKLKNINIRDKSLVIYLIVKIQK